MRKISVMMMTLVILTLLFGSCKRTPDTEYTKYSESFFDTFDTITMVVGYTKSEAEFKTYVNQMHGRFLELHQLYDIYTNYEGVNNVKTINDEAGKSPVKVDREIIDLILFAKDWYNKTGGHTNIAMGSVLAIWHDYRDRGIDEPGNAMLPPLASLKKAELLTDMDKVIVDTEKSTVYLQEEGMRLDVGSVAKGFATELVVKEIMAAGFTSGIISAGGNVRSFGSPLDGVRDKWGIGIQNPDKFLSTEGDSLLDTVYAKDASVVSSGDYQRYYVVDGEKYHHIIDPKTLMPGDYYKAVTIVTQDSGVADFLSTTLFLMPFEESKAMAESLEGVDVIWVMKDGTIVTTEGVKKWLRSNGASGATE